MGVAVGIAVLASLNPLASIGATAPLRELILSTDLSLLISSDTMFEGGASKPYYLGTTIGFLADVVLFGFPSV
jgi:hypothetical protein